MKRVELILVSGLVLAAAAAIGQMNDAQPQSQAKPTPRKTQPAKLDRGQQVFNANCSRCHSTPEGFPPSISGSIAKHMRVRAGLSDADYKALLEFLNP